MGVHSIKRLMKTLLSPAARKPLLLALAMALALAGAAGGTVAWLRSDTLEVKNTFTVGDIRIRLTETGTNADGDKNQLTKRYEMLPGAILHKDPTVYVDARSEDCWLYVRILPSSNFSDFMEYAMADGWTPLQGDMNIFWRRVDQQDESQSFPVLKDHQVKVKNSVTYSALAALTDKNAPTLTITAYAMQRSDQASALATAESAWQALGNVQ